MELLGRIHLEGTPQAGVISSTNIRHSLLGFECIHDRAETDWATRHHDQSLRSLHLDGVLLKTASHKVLQLKKKCQPKISTKNFITNIKQNFIIREYWNGPFTNDQNGCYLCPKALLTFKSWCFRLPFPCPTSGFFTFPLPAASFGEGMSSPPVHVPSPPCFQ